ncbi:hypothetical protein THAOC_18340 [Thalassiosira oceanica]|uniref:Uncharacterized protein n=1 Tax=Thalassiosira oceanica TaxID=159749 RepID=K0S5A1_THAOC|nr:hypothetical protein THAOC_18340 [Thalassiosira oceanica]|mmetsp:Transcript_38744/g.87309  ORF Transcript_38744/g.87309 Transcript_38744/m.87309 type:complete len:396 (+) Transcript_38744:308-1495(+)|eukprot:EJK61213.1 hypothetical protein THAOC_18340 [Thalassiosira oceanica]
MGDEKLAFMKAKTSTEEAAAASRLKREKEMEELRRMRAEAKQGTSASDAAAAAARSKREQEIEELRVLKADSNQEMRDKLAQAEMNLTTDLNAFRNNLKSAKDADRKGKLDAQGALHSYRDARMETDKALEDAELEEKKWTPPPENTHVPSTEIEPPQKIQEAPENMGVEKKKWAPPPKNTLLPPPEIEPPQKVPEAPKMRISNGDCAVQEVKPAPPPKNQPAAPAPDGTVAVLHSPEHSISAPTYTKVDIKFSFGLIVRSSHADGLKENLRDNETLRKCMAGTATILREQMPNPPDARKMQETETSSFMIKYPVSYYDPSLEPNVISIEEDKKDRKEPGKGNKRTLVKASFPVFMRNEPTDKKGQESSSKHLKETKSTVFKALRAAVSGGSFLR